VHIKHEKVFHAGSRPGYYTRSIFQLWEKTPVKHLNTANQQLKWSTQIIFCAIDGRFSAVKLSQGQRKRLGLIVTLLEDKPIFIFDEWAADQDPHFKDYFYKTLLPQLKAQGKTLIIISHDDRYFDCADRVVKMDFGKIVQ